MDNLHNKLFTVFLVLERQHFFLNLVDSLKKKISKKIFFQNYKIMISKFDLMTYINNFVAPFIKNLIKFFFEHMPLLL
jgi:hypothetical protein